MRRCETEREREKEREREREIEREREREREKQFLESAAPEIAAMKQFLSDAKSACSIGSSRHSISGRATSALRLFLSPHHLQSHFRFTHIGHQWLGNVGKVTFAAVNVIRSTSSAPCSISAPRHITVNILALSIRSRLRILQKIIY
jgi:hypothetical protein